MKPHALTLAAALAVSLVGARALAEDLVITNARIVTGTGQVIARGSIVVEDGRIASIGAGGVAGDSSAHLDARGMTVMPGLINTHWHLLQPAAAETEAELAQFIDGTVVGVLETLLESGFTTILSTGDQFPQILKLRARLERGDLRGPRLLAVGPVFTAPNDWPTQVCRGRAGCIASGMVQLTAPEQVAAKVAELAAAGVDGIKLVYDDVVSPESVIDERVVAAIAAEARRHELTVYAHITAMSEPALRLVELGVRAFVHPMPLREPASAGGTARLRELGIPVATTVGLFSAEAAAFNGIAHSERNRAIMANWGGAVQQLADAGVTLAFGTDSATNWCVGCDAPPTVVHDAKERARAEIMIEARTLATLLSNAATIDALTRGAAIFLGRESELGTLERGKIADLVMVDGDPLADIDALANVRTVVKGGSVVSR